MFSLVVEKQRFSGTGLRGRGCACIIVGLIIIVLVWSERRAYEFTVAVNAKTDLIPGNSHRDSLDLGAGTFFSLFFFFSNYTWISISVDVRSSRENRTICCFTDSVVAQKLLSNFDAAAAALRTVKYTVYLT